MEAEEARLLQALSLLPSLPLPLENIPEAPGWVLPSLIRVPQQFPIRRGGPAHQPAQATATTLPGQTEQAAEGRGGDEAAAASGPPHAGVGIRASGRARVPPSGGGEEEGDK